LRLTFRQRCGDALNRFCFGLAIASSRSESFGAEDGGFFSPSAFRTCDSRRPSASRIAARLPASALVTAARRSRSARICSSIDCWMSRGGSIACSSTRVTSTPHPIDASSMTSRIRLLIWSRLASV
jgi:hypothetical protein